MAGVEASKVQFRHPLEHSSQSRILVLDRVAEAVAGGVEVGKQALDVELRWIAAGRGLDGLEDVGQIGVQALVGVGVGRDVHEKLTGIDEVALGLDGVVFGGLDVLVIVRHGGVVHAGVAASDVVDEVLADEAIEQGAEHVLLEVPSVDGSTNVVSDVPDLALQCGSLFVACHVALGKVAGTKPSTYACSGGNA